MCIRSFWPGISSGNKSWNIDLNSCNTLYVIVPKIQVACMLPRQLWTTHTIWPLSYKQFCLEQGDESLGLKICDAGNWIHMWPCCCILFENCTATACVRTWLVYWNCIIIRTVFWWHCINEWKQTGVRAGYPILRWHGTINWWVNTFSIACSFSYTS